MKSMMPIKRQLFDGLYLPLYSFTLPIRYPILLLYFGMLYLLTILYLKTPNIFNTELGHYLPIPITIFLLSFLKTIPRIIIYAACSYHITEILKKNSVTFSSIASHIARISGSLFIVMCLYRIPTILELIIDWFNSPTGLPTTLQDIAPHQAGSLMNWIMGEGGSTLTILRFIWPVVMFYVLIIVAIEKIGAFRALIVSFKALIYTWLAAFIGAQLFGLLEFSFEYAYKWKIFPWLSSLGLLTDPITHRPTLFFDATSSLEFWFLACITLLTIIFKTLLYKQYKDA